LIDTGGVKTVARRRSIACGLAGVAAMSLAAGRLQSPVALDELLNRASSYVGDYERAFSAIVSEERYVQRLTGSGVNESRHLRSDLILMTAGESGWLIFRDVYEVDGHAVRDRDDRVLELLLKPPPDAYEQANRIADEGARFNIGPMQRTINTPTVALMFLRRELLPRSEFRIAGRGTEQGVAAVILRFQERGQPRIVNTRDNAAARGRFWIDPASGRVLKSELELDSAGMHAFIVVTYAPQPKLDLWVPAIMTERYRTQTTTGNIAPRDLRDGAGSGSGVVTLTVEGTATYGNFRRFSVDVKTIIRN
jgi:hypothetical protein